MTWEGAGHRLVFSHEASYVPFIEIPAAGIGHCNQFFEGNRGYAELFNNNGRKTRNSFVDVIEAGPKRAWVRWNYLCVNQDTDSQPAIRGAEDYISYPNGLVWRRLTYESLMPDRPEGYSWQPIDFFAFAPNGTEWKDLFARDASHGDYAVASVLDAYSDRQYDIYWDDRGKPRRNGDAALLLSISQSRGLAMVWRAKAGLLFTILGEASGFPRNHSQVVDHSFKDTGGWGWGAIRWDHWPVGWLNSQAHDYQPGVSPYPYHFGPLSHYVVKAPITNAAQEFDRQAADMDHNRWSERRVYYTVTGVARDLESIRKLAREWLDRGARCAMPAGIADIRWQIPKPQ